MLEKDGDQLDRSCEKGRRITCSQGRKEDPAYSKKRKANWIGHILHRFCLLKYVIEGKVDERMEVIHGRIEVSGRRKQLLEDLQKRILELEGGSTRSHSVDNWLWKRQWTCRKADCGMNY